MTLIKDAQCYGLIVKILPEALLIRSFLAFKSKMFKEGMQFSAFNIFIFFVFVHAPRPDNLKVWQMQYWWWCSVGIWKKIRGISRCQPDTDVGIPKRGLEIVHFKFFRNFFCLCASMIILKDSVVRSRAYKFMHT